jgi:hypothetical protein
MDEEKDIYQPDYARTGRRHIPVAEAMALRQEFDQKPDEVSTRSWSQLQKPRIGIHSMMAYLFAAGHTDSEVMEATGYSLTRIHTIRHSEVMVKEIKAIQEKYLGDDIQKRIRQIIIPKAVKISEEIMEDESVKPAIRLQAASMFMDRGLGRPQQTVEFGGSMLRAIYEKLDKMEATKIVDVGKTEEVSENFEPDKWVNENL